MSWKIKSKKTGCDIGKLQGWACLVSLLFSLLFFTQTSLWAEARPDWARLNVATATNALQLRRLISRPEAISCSARLEGIVIWTSPAKDRLILQDDSGGVVVSMDLRSQPPLEQVHRVLLQGNCVAGRGGMSSELVVDNDGNHAAGEKTGAVYLTAGLLPIRLEWFNGDGDVVLEVKWMGPQMPCELIPSAALFRTQVDSATGERRLEEGLDYRSYEGTWGRLPDFPALPVTTAGIATNFDIGVRSRGPNVGLVFQGYLRVPREGNYRFWVNSDDGAKLYIDNPPFRLSILGTSKLPQPHQIAPGQLIPEEQECQWAEAEGTVTQVSELPEAVFLELASNRGRLYLKVMKGSDGGAELLLHSRIKANGVYQTSFLFDGQTVQSLLVPSFKQVLIMEMAPEYWVDYPVLPISALIQSNVPSAQIVHINGTVCSNSPGTFQTIEEKGAQILVEGAQAPAAIGDHVEVLGRCVRTDKDVVLRESFYRKIHRKAGSDTNGLPLLTTVEEVKNLSRSEAQRGYPVKIRGVITARLGDGFTIQDSTWSVFMRWKDRPDQDPLRIGDYWEIEGITYMDFAPNVHILSANCLGPGILPDPLRPTRNELLNGSLDTKYVEIQGVVAGVLPDGLSLLTREGKFEIQFYNFEPTVPTRLDDALIRVRGVTSPVFDEAQRISLARLPFYSPSVIVDVPAPVDPFAVPLKHVSDLFLFDPHADALRRVRIAGQVIGEYEGEFFLMDGANGLRFKLKTPEKLRAGEMVEIVGFPNMAGPTPVLREALAHRTDKVFLPDARQLPEQIPLNGKYDATWVRVTSQLIGVNDNRSEKVLELQSGDRRFLARLKNDHGLLSDIVPGSRVELTGIYVGQGGDRAASRDIDSFELLLNSPLNIHVLERPSWWTIKHALTVMGALVFVILIALVWITSLRRQVEQRSRQLTAEIRCREQTEQQRALEEERARIAQDLHDDLGAGLTQIRFLSAVESRDLLVPEQTRSQLKQVSEKSNQMVASLDEIVWAVNPANDSLPSLAAYLCHVAEEFFRGTTVRCRLDVDDMLPSVSLTSEVRHNLYLAVREALNNIAKHSCATEAWLRIRCKEHVLDIAAQDNGCGFDGASTSSLGNGLLNMRRRMEKIGGRFECDSSSTGTTCRISLPLKDSNNAH